MSTSWTLLNNDPHNTCKAHNNFQPKTKSSILMPSDIQVHRQVPLNNAKILEETKLDLHKVLKKFDSIISKSDNDIGQMDLIEIHIATRPDSAPAAAQPYPSALKHQDFLKQEIRNLLDAGIICMSMSP